MSGERYRLTWASSLVIMSICLFQLPSSESCSPRCLCSVTVLMIVLFIIRLGWWGLYNFREIVMVSVFCGLKFTSHFVDHACNFTMPSLSVCAVSCGSSTIKYRLVSLANNFIVLINIDQYVIYENNEQKRALNRPLGYTSIYVMPTRSISWIINYDTLFSFRQVVFHPR